jgi:regulator of protease activity HflC (stomatin/prohibitin superfamily)
VLQAQIRERLSTYLQEFGITVIDLLLRDVTFDPDFVAAIEAKTIAENQLAQKEFEIEEARQNARSTVAAAQGEAGRLEAKADALNQNPEYLNVVKSGVLGDTLDTLITE